MKIEATRYFKFKINPNKSISEIIFENDGKIPMDDVIELSQSEFQNRDGSGKYFSWIEIDGTGMGIHFD